MKITYNSTSFLFAAFFLSIGLVIIKKKDNAKTIALKGYVTVLEIPSISEDEGNSNIVTN